MSHDDCWENKGLYRKYKGIVTGKEIHKSLEDAGGDARMDSLNYVINDFLDMTEMDVSIEELKKISALDYALALSNPTVKIAIVGTEEGFQAMATLYGSISYENPYESKVFGTIEDAREWVK